jgi:hypothetical protein
MKNTQAIKPKKSINKKKTENVEKSAPKQRIIGRPFPKGVSGNPAGKPKGTFSLLTILKKELQKIPRELKGKERKQYAELLVKKVLHKAIVEGDDATIRLIFNYTEGMPKENIDIKSGGKPIPLLGGDSNGNQDTSNRKTIKP